MHNLRPAEIPSAIHLDLSLDDWSTANALLTPSEKPNRSRLRHYYQVAIDAMFATDTAQAQVAALPEATESTGATGPDADVSMEGRICGLVVNILGLDPSLNRDELLCHSFADLGGDSVKSMKFKTRLGGLNAAAASVSNAVTLHKPLRELAAVLEGHITGSMLSTWRQAKLDNISAQMDRDSKLPELQDSSAGHYDATAAQDVLLTGATGFVGAHFLAKLLQLSSGCQWNVRCLVRCKNVPDGLQRLRAVVTTQYMLPVDEACWLSRVQIIPGSLSDDRFGLDDSAWADLCLHVRSVVHLAARVAFWDEYEEARLNVVGTVTILRLCAASRPRKPLHHASTLSVFGDRGAPGGSTSIDESFPIGISAAASGVLQSEGYSQSKWVCEKLVSRAAIHRKWCIPVCIYRIGYVSFSASSGVANANGWFHKLLIGVAQAAAAPPTPAESLVNLAPVDNVARALADLFLLHERQVAPEPTGSTVYHLLNAAGGMPIAVFFDALESTGLPLRRCATHREFFETLSDLDESNPLFSLAPWFEHGLPLEAPFKAPQTMEHLRGISEDWRSEDGRGWSVLGAEVLSRHIRWLERMQLVPAATMAR